MTVIRLTHVHVCNCGTRLECAAEPDKCAVIEPFDCPTCLQQQRDDYFQQIAQLRAEISDARKDPDHANHR